MGYYTSFSGSFRIEPALKKEHWDYLEMFLDKRHMRLDVEQVKDLPDPRRKALGLPIGVDGEFCVAVQETESPWTAAGMQLEPKRVGDRPGLALDPNRPPGDVPSLYTYWRLEEGPEEHYLSGPEDSAKFYEYVEWLTYLLEKFFIPWGYQLTGDVEWRGEDDDDAGQLELVENKLTVCSAQRTYRAERVWSVDEETRTGSWQNVR